MRLINVAPQSQEWPEFIQLSFQYIGENWPQAIKGQTSDDFFQEYGQELLHRISQGTRGLFLIKEKGGTIGLANVYIEWECLNIAEFYIKPANRRKGFGTKALEEVIHWGRLNRCRTVRAEVDKSLEKANQFWYQCLDSLNASGERCVYSKPIANMKTQI
ncbi:MAG: GNAT family N-acetyltransferase [Pseudomonadota bacterium]